MDSLEQQLRDTASKLTTERMDSLEQQLRDTQRASTDVTVTQLSEKVVPLLKALRPILAPVQVLYANDYT
jgi:hypothetical protein